MNTNPFDPYHRMFELVDAAQYTPETVWMLVILAFTCGFWFYHFAFGHVRCYRAWRRGLGMRCTRKSI